VQLGAAIRSAVLSAAVAITALACKRGGEARECEVAVLRYWDSLDIDPYFSAVSLADAVARCETVDARARRCASKAPSAEIAACPGIDELPADRGWRAGLYCYVSSDSGWSRCERSNRECEYYRRVAQRDGRQVSRCTAAELAWAIVHHGDPVDPQPSSAECERVRKDLLASGRITESSQCQEVTHAVLVGGRRRFIPSPSTR